MFTILLIDNRNTIQSVVKYLLYRYDLVYCNNPDDAADIIEKNNIDMIIVNLPFSPGCGDQVNKLTGWIKKKKTIAILEMVIPQVVEQAKEWGVLEYLDKMDIGRLPRVVNRHLNQASTRILNING